LISNGEVFGIAISPLGDELFYVNAYGGRDSLHIFHSKKLNDEWQKPQPTSFSIDNINQIDPSFSPDGKTLLINAYISDDKKYDVYSINKTETGWSEPQVMSDQINTDAHEFYATMTSNRNVYFTRRNESNDIYVSKYDNGKYQKAVPLKGEINTEFSESNPYISPEEDYIIFISDREGGYGGADLYISFNNKDVWSAPINFGPKINTKDSEFCPSQDYSNERFFFARTILDGKRRIENIYSIPMDALNIDELKSQSNQ
jgi:Tol biopolymer transport system component